MTAAWILGNGPTLPVDSLYLLRGYFTVGVNRIWLSGFIPTVLMWNDWIISQNHREEINELDCVKICPRRLAINDQYGVDAFGGRNYGPYTKARQIMCKGNMGVAAARWARFLGFKTVYLLGMGAKEVGGMAHFYKQLPGKNTNKNYNYQNYQRALDEMHAESDCYVHVETAAHLHQTLDDYSGPYCVDWREWIKGKLNENQG